MARTVSALVDYGNAWAANYMYLGIYKNYVKNGDSKGIQKVLKFVRDHVDTVEEYQERRGIRFEPDFTSVQKKRMNNLVDIYNRLSSEEMPDADKMYRIADRQIKLVRKWSSPFSSRQGP